jgi:hypothetical protein
VHACEVLTLHCFPPQEPDALHGLYGRNPLPGCEYNYRQPPPGDVALVLTKVMVTDHRFCKAYFESSQMMEDVAKQGNPYWNGEDIFMALVSRKITGQLPKRYDLLLFSHR